MQQPLYTFRLNTKIRVNLHPLNACTNTRELAVGIEVSTNNLDEGGRVIDVGRLLNGLNSTWNTKNAWNGSCERMAGGVVNLIYDVMGLRAESINVLISPNNGTTVLELNWKGGPLPTLVPEPSQRPDYRLPKGTYSGKTLKEVPDGYVAYLARSRFAWLDMIQVTKRMEEIVNAYTEQ